MWEPNIPKRQKEEQDRLHAEYLRQEIDKIIQKLNNILGVGNYGVSQDGTIDYKVSDLELGSDRKKIVAELEKELKKHYEEIRQLGVEIFRNILGNIH